MYHALLGYDGHTALEALRTTAHPDGQGDCEETTDDRIRPERELVLILLLTLVLPCPSLWASHVLSESESEPGIAAELFGEPIELIIKLASILLLKENSDEQYGLS